MTAATRPSLWAYWLRYDQQRAADQVIAAYRETHGVATQAARLLGVSHRSILRYVRALGLQGQIAEIRDAHARGVVRKMNLGAPRGGKTRESALCSGKVKVTP